MVPWIRGLQRITSQLNNDKWEDESELGHHSLSYRYTVVVYHSIITSVKYSTVTSLLNTLLVQAEASSSTEGMKYIRVS